MAYKLFKGKWQVRGDKPTISILSTGLICFNQVCYERFVRSRLGRDSAVASPSGYTHVKLYYDPEMKKIAFEPLQRKTGEFVLPIKLIKTGLLAIVRGKTFLEHFGIKYKGKARSYPAHQITLPEFGSGYKRTRSRVKGIEIRLDEYIEE